MKNTTVHALAAALALALTLGAPVAHAQTPIDTQVRVSSFEYDASGLLIREVVEPDRPSDCLQTGYVHDGFGNRVSASASACSGAGGHTLVGASTPRTITTQYAAHSITLDGVSYSSAAGTFPTRTTNALGQSENREYDPRHGGVTRLVGPNGGITIWAYDGFGRKTREHRVDGTSTTWVYQFCQLDGQPRDPVCPVAVGPHAIHWYVSEASHDSTNAPLGPVKYQFHDTLDRIVRVQTLDFEGKVILQDTHYNTLGQLSQKSILHRSTDNSPSWATFTYDALGRVTAETAPDGNGGQVTTRFAYSGLVTTITNPLNQTQTIHKNASGQTAKVVDHLGSEVAYTHDALGLLTQTNAAGAITRIGYTHRGYKASMQAPAMGAWDYAYNAFGELVWQQDSLSQVSTMAYDALGRMIQRTEPDLTSHWYYDKKADNTHCGAGIGKLCEATADNGYRRLHTYDAIGRPTSTATALDSTVNLAVVSQAYDANTGRLASQSWPTGYQATYGYNAQGFLSQVTGGGVTGHAQVVSLEVLAMDPQGRIIQYKQGNDVTTVKAYDQPTGRQHSVQATKTGQSTGNVLDHGYTYDKLGNLLTRTDANTGVTENFQYDSLNRLGMYSVMGGGISGTEIVQTLYDAAGNLKYKSDVGYYHYDAQRPNRLNHVTLAPEANWSAIGAVTQANTGTRALSYAYDDTRTGARNLTPPNGNWPMGNGNLWYTVSQDQASGRHTVRWETYTSFNMPKELLLGDLAPAPSQEPAIVSGYTCPQGDTLQGSNCIRSVLTPTSTVANSQPVCPAGYALSGTTCSKVDTTAASPYCKVPGTTVAAYFFSGTNECLSAVPYVSRERCVVLANTHAATLLSFIGKSGPMDDRTGICVFSVSHSCPAGATMSGITCSQTVTQAATLSYSCPAGATLSGTTCQGTTTTLETQPASPVYGCPAGMALNGTTCSNPTATVAERTLSFAYGPEHQRIRQTVALTSGAPSHMESGTTWYLNGEDSQGLTYEKEVTANGSTEHKHYLSAAGITFALYVKREGNLNGQPAASVRYFHHDHLGSIAAVTDEAGAVIERLAYDPWGKRRFANGMSDVDDALHGMTTDRGYTMHEHLDEMGIVHMNGRIYDPLIGRFMSADPFIQAPGNLQSHNRYAYVLNNPLAYTDPSGYFVFELAAYVFIGAEIAKQLGIIDKGIARTIQGVAAAFMTGQWATAAGYGKVAAGVMGGFVGGFVGSGGNFEAGVLGGLTGGMFGYVGAEFHAGTFGSYAGHAVVGCVSTVARGGGCGSGATSALFGKFTSHELIGGIGEDAGLGEVIAKGVATAVAGGIGSRITGGQFANGALTAAYGYLFNQASGRRGCTAGNYMTCAMGDRESEEWRTADSRIKAGVVAVADATDKAAQTVAVGCVATANPCAVPATLTAVGAKTVSQVLAPSGPREMALNAFGDFFQATLDRLVIVSPATYFFSTATMIVTTEAVKPAVKAADQQRSR